MIGILLMTHGLFGQELLRCAEEMIGKQEKAVSIAVTSETGRDALQAEVAKALEQVASPGGVICLVDLLGGSPCNAAMLRAKDPAIEVVTGVNLYMVVSAIRHRHDMTLSDLAARLIEDGRKAVTRPKELLARRLAS